MKSSAPASSEIERRCQDRFARDVGSFGERHRPSLGQERLQPRARVGIVFDKENARLELLCARHAR